MTAGAQVEESGTSPGLPSDVGLLQCAWTLCGELEHRDRRFLETRDLIMIHFGAIMCTPSLCTNNYITPIY